MEKKQRTAEQEKLDQGLNNLGAMLSGTLNKMWKEDTGEEYEPED